ncbi:MAG: N-acetylmuramoyl-L-alanine amidase [Verrucomicrobiota bacterium]
MKTASLFAQQPATPADEEKRQRFLKAREEMRTVPIAPKNEATPKPKPRASRSTPDPATPEPAAKAVPLKRPAAPKTEPVPEPPKPPATPAPATPVPATPPPAPALKPLPPLAPPPLPPPRPPVVVQSAPVTIERSGFEQNRGLQPVPFKGWFTRWRYLSKAVREQIDRAPVLKHRWRYVVVHNSGTRQGNAKAFEYYHTRVRKMPNGLAYQFVIGNGTSSGDGEIEIGNRWVRQINGGHVHSDYLNNIALGICLVGDLNREAPTKRQLEALEELIRYVRLRVGQIDHKFAIVKAHREINPPRWPTDCPGTNFPYQWLRTKFD